MSSSPRRSLLTPRMILWVVGMAVGTVFTLYVVPAFYMLIARDHAKARARAGAGAAGRVEIGRAHV